MAQTNIYIGKQKLPLELLDSQSVAEFIATSPATIFFEKDCQAQFRAQANAISQNGRVIEEVSAGDLCYEPASLRLWLFTKSQKLPKDRLLIKLGTTQQGWRAVEEEPELLLNKVIE
ncbi:cyclophilin-like fold protein [Enterococcus sp. HY326]|uniref:cyclophilin-like fold protein n=1 Tax=Enterococcus sp. HY326 TaxID=2971265 RepID=UPI00223FA2E2|nr:cyclophilin-like fold protein [Enterococcus sp. HY326]